VIAGNRAVIEVRAADPARGGVDAAAVSAGGIIANHYIIGNWSGS
jgi:hypothetical protein